jgi:hypothetical protein
MFAACLLLACALLRCCGCRVVRAAVSWLVAAPQRCSKQKSIHGPVHGEWAKEKDMVGADRWASCGRLNAGKWKSGFENWGCQPE